ncbi:MAG: hypothetical protein IT381_11550 [Deltaproteobacteria bacterium]|nr:hypothetical protein [Deltaproteobacteria bacterium]
MTERDENALERFVWSYIDSVGLLDILLLLRSNETKHWTPQKVAIELRSQVESTKGRLEQLRTSGLVRGEPDGYVYQPDSEEKRALVTALAEAYRQRRVSLITLIFERPRDSLREFADAFKIRKDP